MLSFVLDDFRTKMIAVKRDKIPSLMASALANKSNMMNSQLKTIVFVTGAFTSNKVWDAWRVFFEARGYITIAPPYPYKDASAGVLRRRHPDVLLASVHLSQVIEHYASVIQQLPEKPVLIGHSLGGLVTQVLINRDLAVAGVAIHSFPPQGVVPYELTFWRSWWKVLCPFTSKTETYLMSFKTWQYFFTNGMALDEQTTTYINLLVPESKLILKNSLLAKIAIDFKKPHVPLLLLGGSADKSIPASLNRRNFKMYRCKDSVTDFKVMRGRNHFVVCQPTWRQDAAYILAWLEKQSPQR
ncbi:alpha/beta hydrolase [Flavitalea antarctica]